MHTRFDYRAAPQSDGRPAAVDLRSFAGTKGPGGLVEDLLRQVASLHESLVRWEENDD